MSSAPSPQPPGPLVVLARVAGTVGAPIAEVWSVLADFAHPERVAPTIERCETFGRGVGAIRHVGVRGLVIHERLEELDPVARRLQYAALDTGDMPAPGLTAYRATVVLTARTAGATGVEWLGEGRTEGSVGPLKAHFAALYQGAIASLAVQADAQGPR